MFHMLIAIGLAAIGLVVVLYLAASVVCLVAAAPFAFLAVAYRHPVLGVLLIIGAMALVFSL
jgi:hypothetical protein